MRIFNWFPLYAQSRFSRRTVVHFILEMSGKDSDWFGPEARVLEQRMLRLLDSSGVLEDGEHPRFAYSGEEPSFSGAELLCQVAVLFQVRAGHPVAFFRVDRLDNPDRFRCLVEHQHADVGMTACKLAWEAFSGQRMLLAAPFRAFRAFAEERRLPGRTAALLEAAARRGIPVRKLDQQPMPGTDFAGIIPRNRSVANGLVALGHGPHAVVIEGLECIGPASRCAGLPPPAGQEDDLERIEALLDHLFPDGQRGTVPLLTVTGTNGKTTTSRMATHILAASGARPGLACSDGLYVGDATLELGEFAALGGHLRILARDDIDCAVLETHHRAIYQVGMPYDQSDVSVCLNVTGDHVSRDGVETMEELVEIKRALLERAVGAVVLFADDDRCLGMLPHLQAENACLVSLHRSHDEVRRLAGRPVDTCTLGPDGQIVMTGPEGGPLEFGHAEDLPATRDGTAPHNLGNAMHAMAAAFYLGVDPGIIGRAMRSFGSDYDQTPGRLNVHDNGSFRTVLDSAHNPDAFRKLTDFARAQVVTGRRLIAFQVPGNRSRELMEESARVFAGAFDHYVIRSPRVKGEIPDDESKELIRNELLRAGVPAERITVDPRRDGDLERFLALGRPGDLLVYTSPAPSIHRDWTGITAFEP